MDNEREPESKADLLTMIRNERSALEGVLAWLSPSQMTEPVLDGGWSVKDVLAHLMSWEQFMLNRLLPAGSGSSTPPGVDFASGDIEVINEQIYRANRDRSLADVQADFDASYKRVIQEIEALPEEYLFAPTENGEPRWKLIPGDTYQHYREHREAIQSSVGALSKARSGHLVSSRL